MNTDRDIAMIRRRIGELNAKAYYLLVALSFLYSKANTPSWSLKIAIVLTAFVAVAPVQDVFECCPWYRRYLCIVRWGKVVILWAAFFCMLYWIVYVSRTVADTLFV